MKPFDKFLVPVKNVYVLKINKNMALSIQCNLFLTEAWDFLLKYSMKDLRRHTIGLFQTFLKRLFFLRLECIKIIIFSNILCMYGFSNIIDTMHTTKNTCANGNEGSSIIYLNDCFLLGKKLQMYSFIDDSIRI